LFLLWLLFFLLEPRISALGNGLARYLMLLFVSTGLAAAAIIASSFLGAAVGVRLIAGSAGQAFAVHVLLPMSERLGRVFRLAPDTVKGAFIDFNNALVRARPAADTSTRGSASAAGLGRVAAFSAKPGSVPPRLAPASSAGASTKVLLLLPHCLQNSECSRVLGEDVRNCGECGSCAMCDLRRLVSKYDVQNRIVGGGALALMAVRQLRPRAVVGVACERELVAAIKELRGIPVIAIANRRPDGPCRNTEVDVAGVEEGLQILLKHPGGRCTIH
jgi:hypothetical protein